VENATAVSIAPPVERLSPSLNRCFDVTPRRTTHYVLMAAGAGGQSATASFDITVLATPSTGPVAIEQIPGPTIEYFRDDGVTREGDSAFHKLCFATRGATQVRVDPAVIPPMNTPLGCFTARVDRTTSFTLFAFDERGNAASRRLTISR
jgi:hypothetical protein